MRKVLFITLITLVATATLSANWPHWRGPSFYGVSTEKNLPVTWSATENISWKLALPAYSGSTPIIWNDLVFLNVATDTGVMLGRDGAPPAGGGVLELWAVNRNTKDVAWKRPLADQNYRQRKQNMSSPSPVTDGRTVWVMTGVGILKAFDFTGKELWVRDIQKDYGNFGLNWGYASSPLLHEGALYVQVLHGMKTDDPSYVMRIDAATGKTAWKVERPTPAVAESPDSYATPALLQYDGKTEIVILGGDVVTGHDPATGAELWRVGGLNPRNQGNYRIVSSPIVAGGMIIAPTRENPLTAIRPGGRGDVTSSHVAWRLPQYGPDVPSPVSDGTYLYLVNDRGIVHCLDIKTGAVVYGPERLPTGAYSSSPVLADGKIYITTEVDGITHVFRAGPKFELLASNSLDGDCAPYCLSSVAISQGQLFLKTSKTLWVVGERRR
jgi:outer membrane protein assembly factor BamB